MAKASSPESKKVSVEVMIFLIDQNLEGYGQDSLEQIMREENNSTSLPVITIANLTRFDERDYREECIERLIEVSMYIDNYLGSRRVFIPSNYRSRNPRTQTTKLMSFKQLLGSIEKQ